MPNSCCAADARGLIVTSGLATRLLDTLKGQPLRNVTLRQLKIFETVARLLSYSRAAEELHLTQPAVSMQVRSLEESVGLPLFEQMGKKVFLTPAGSELARHARAIGQQLRTAEEAIASLKGAQGGRLVIGVVSTAKYFAPRLLAVFRACHGPVELRLEVHNRERIVQMLEDNQIDLAIMGAPPGEFPTIAGSFAEHPLGVIADPTHPLASAETVRSVSLAAEPWLVREPGSGTRSAFERFLANTGLKPASLFEMSSNETIKQAVMAGMGIAFISAHAIKLELEAGRLILLEVPGTPVLRRWYVVRRAEKQLMPVGERFVDFLMSEAAGLIEGSQGKGSTLSSGLSAH